MSCGKPVGGLWDSFKERTAAGEEKGKVLDELGIKNYCCRALFMTHRDILAEVGKFRV